MQIVEIKYLRGGGNYLNILAPKVESECTSFPATRVRRVLSHHFSHHVVDAAPHSGRALI